MKYQYHDKNKEHLHELDGKPLLGTSTVVKVISKPLTWWASGLAVAEMGWVKPLKPYDKPKPTKEQIDQNAQQRLESAGVHLLSLKDMDSAQYLALLDKAYKAHSVKLDKSADQGTDMHAELEAYVEWCISKKSGQPMKVAILPEGSSKEVKIFSEWASENVKRFIVSEGHCYSERLWTGGITDCVAELNDGKLAIIDFKSSKEAYLSQFIQVGGYDIEASENGLFDDNGNLICKLDREVDCYIIFPFGAGQILDGMGKLVSYDASKVEPQFNYDTVAMRKGFEAASVLYKIIN